MDDSLLSSAAVAERRAGSHEALADKEEECGMLSCCSEFIEVRSGVAAPPIDMPWQKPSHTQTVAHNSLSDKALPDASLCSKPTHPANESSDLVNAPTTAATTLSSTQQQQQQQQQPFFVPEQQDAMQQVANLTTQLASLEAHNTQLQQSLKAKELQLHNAFEASQIQVKRASEQADQKLLKAVEAKEEELHTESQVCCHPDT